MTSTDPATAWPEPKPTALLVLADGTVLQGFGLGAEGHAVGEVCFNTAMTGYEEILTDPSYAGQIITFTFPHIGNVGANDEDIEALNMAATPGARGVILRADITDPSNYRATRHLDQWLKARGIIGLSGIDTRALTTLIRSKGMPNAVIAHNAKGEFDLDALRREAAAWPGLEGMDLVPRLDEVGGHPSAHVAEADEGDFAHFNPLRNRFASSVVEMPRARVSTMLDTNGGWLVLTCPSTPRGASR